MSLTPSNRYGEPQHALPRKVRKIGKNETSLELRPPEFTVLTLVNEADPSIVGPPPQTVTMSCDSTVHELVQELVRTVASDLVGTPSRVWSLQQPRTQIEGSQYPMSRLLQLGGELLVDDEKAQTDTLEYSVIGPKVFAVEFQVAGAWLVDETKVPVAQPGPEPENPFSPIFNSGSDFFSKMQNSAPKVASDVKMHSPSPSVPFKPASAIRTAGTSKARVPGTLGLGNMYGGLA
jgi:ubiquitin carboxyl-terminal hydrolase 4/11/15